MHFEKALLYAITPFLCFIIGYMLCSYKFGNQTYQTPNLIGLLVYDAIKETSPAHINVQIISEKENNDFAPGTIIYQKPSPGRLIKAHQQILVITSKKTDPIIAPDFSKKSLSIIQKNCYDSHIKLKSYPLDYNAPQNTCIAQIPEKNDTINDKKMIIYIAQSPINLYIMPDLTNHNLEKIMTLFKDQPITLHLFHKSEKLSPPYHESMKIIAQKPIAGSLVSFKPPLNVYLEINW